MSRSSLLAAFALLLLPLAAAADPLDGRRIAGDVQVLASDAYEGRAPQHRPK